MTEILVTGATGNVGRHVVAHLQTADAPVRAFVRKPTTAQLPEQVRAVGGSLTEPDTLVAALKGIDTVFLIWPFLTAEGAPDVLEAIARHARRLVYLSATGVNPAAARQTDAINQLHADMERLIEESGVPHTLLRSDTLAANARGWAEQIRTTHTVRGPEIAATAVVHEQDVAAVAARALTDDRQTGAVHLLTGPEILSRADQARTIGEEIGHPVAFEPVPVAAAREQMLADGRPPALVEALLSSAENRPASTVVTSTVAELTGAPARTFRSWVQENAAAFR